MSVSQTSSKKLLWTYSIIMIIIGFAIGFFVGRSSGKKSCVSIESSTQSSYSSSCKTCKEIKTCDEAKKLLSQGCTDLDRDKDGVPCESLCGKKK